MCRLYSNKQMTSMTTITKSYLPAFAWLLFITGMSLVPKIQLPKFDLFSTDKIGHMAAYGLLVWLILYGFKKQNERNMSWKEGVAIVIGTTLYGALLEFVQGNFIPGRFFGYDDMIANAAGALAAWGLFSWKLRPA
ncbi:MAG: hypothetical protein DYG98_09830 [Haliscomenobacteraceae bacterium CHB4]|nr:hypothetical protein [Haliscomenobacteraceae bacterium CHB4]